MMHATCPTGGVPTCGTAFVFVIETALPPPPIDKPPRLPMVKPFILNARCRTKNDGPCGQPGMKNGRCKMHGGVFYKREKHGETTLRAIKQRKQERALLKGLKL